MKKNPDQEESQRIVLLVEDHPEEAQQVIGIFQKNFPEFQVEHVTSGEAALEFVFATGNFEFRNRKSIPEFIFLDLGLPRMSGFEVLDVIKSYDRTRNIPVIIVSSSHDEKVIATSYQLGANDYLIKPLHTADLRRLLSRHSELPQSQSARLSAPPGISGFS